MEITVLFTLANKVVSYPDGLIKMIAEMEQEAKARGDTIRDFVKFNTGGGKYKMVYKAVPIEVDHDGEIRVYTTYDLSYLIQSAIENWRMNDAI